MKREKSIFRTPVFVDFRFTSGHILYYNNCLWKGSEGMKGRRLHRFIWALLTPALWLFARVRFRYHPHPQPLKEPFLAVSNHCNDLDPVLLALSVRKQCYFIASEHIFRKGLGGKLLMALQAPIVRQKGTTAGDTALTAIRRLRKGYNVAVFAEGNRSYNGQTGAIVASTAKLAKASGACLVTHRFRGGYLTAPRWADHARCGRLDGEIVGIYPPEMLKTMTAAEVADILRRDIYENAFDTQRERMIAYRGKKTAEHIERALYLCPICGKGGGLHSRGDELSCSCGMRTRLNVYGFFEGGELPFDNMLDWDKWQAGQMLALMQNAGDECIASDDGIVLDEVTDEGTLRRRGCGTLCLYRDRFELCGEVFPFAAVSGIALSGPQGLELACGEQHWFITSPNVCNLRKYATLYRAASAPEEILAV